jgi:hypothetical protein
VSACRPGLVSRYSSLCPRSPGQCHSTTHSSSRTRFGLTSALHTAQFFRAILVQTRIESRIKPFEYVGIGGGDGLCFGRSELDVVGWRSGEPA